MSTLFYKLVTLRSASQGVYSTPRSGRGLVQSDQQSDLYLVVERGEAVFVFMHGV
jgi:hypothetical protein